MHFNLLVTVYNRYLMKINLKFTQRGKTNFRDDVDDDYY